VPAEEQWRRLAPVIAGLMKESPAPCLSVDTASAEVARRSLDAGAQVVNDVYALGDPAMAGVVAGAQAGLVLMHMQGNPATMQLRPHYDDVLAEVGAFLSAKRAEAAAAGVASDCIALDPGVGFGKSVEHSLALLGRLDRLETGGRPILIGLSRKSLIGRILGDLAVDKRLEGGLAATAIAVLLGARIVRTHDVVTTSRAVRMADALRVARGGAAGAS
jgi:dihydropteroate synthase